MERLKVVIVGLVEKAESMSPRMDNWDYDRRKARYDRQIARKGWKRNSYGWTRGKG